MILSLLPYTDTSSPAATTCVRLPTRQNPPVKVRELVDILATRNGRHRCEFDAGGRGCRFWVRDQIPLLLREGVLVDEKVAESARGEAELAFPGRVPWPMDGEGRGGDMDMVWGDGENSMESGWEKETRYE
ncbi:hypothetical protein AJ80_09658 [Polytolypa hystricis UAMH7299]|uniref:DUF7770 domain-containing protein n=1 Tax=Polytolypa hystricis (strain UAMH7299) TaxID=1447883 RepID=A0A2B7WLN4_POLH7|nr:hypothetical protein AJ80_09658 [Polytolypa hystricis UAMH7299]